MVPQDSHGRPGQASFMGGMAGESSGRRVKEMKKNPRMVLFMVMFLLGVCIDNVFAAQYLLVKGDLHRHSSFSHDSETPIEQVIAWSEETGYDFITLTEHNTLRHLKKDWSTPDLLVISGYELTTTGGHFNIFGLRDFSKKSAFYDRETLADYLSYLKGLGGLVQVDHPNDAVYPTRFGYELPLDMIEVVNGHWDEDDARTLADFQELLESDRRLTATLGTDAHNNHPSRRGANNVYVTEVSEKGVLEALEAGHSYITLDIDGPIVRFYSGDAIMGDAIRFRSGVSVTLEIEQLQGTATLKVYDQSGLRQDDIPVNGPSFSLDIPVNAPGFVRVEIWGNDGKPVVITNPLFFT